MASNALSDAVRQLEAYSDELNQQSKTLLAKFDAIVAERNTLLGIVRGMHPASPVVAPGPVDPSQARLAVPMPRPETKKRVSRKKKKSAVRKAAST